MAHEYTSAMLLHGFYSYRERRINTTYCDSPQTFGIGRVNSWVALTSNNSRVPSDVSATCEAGSGRSKQNKQCVINPVWTQKLDEEYSTLDRVALLKI